MLDVTEQPVTDSTPAPGEGEELENQGLEGQQGEQEPEEIEEELEGVKLRGKKELLEKFKGERLMQADYTRKTQEVAEQRRAIEAQREQFQQLAQSHQQHLREVAQIVGIEERLAQFNQINWHQLNAENPQQAQAYLIEFNQLQAARGQLTNSLTQRQQQQALQTQQETAKRLQEGQAVLQREIKGWSPDLAQKLMQYGQSIGFQSQQLQNITDPAVVVALHRAYMFDQLQKQSKPAPVTQKPVTRVNGTNASNAKPLSEVTDPAEWAKLRQQRKSKT